jgi:uncharacterized protein (TIGR01244 family)
MRSLLTVVLTSSLLGLPNASCAAKPRVGGGIAPSPSPDSPTAAAPKDATATAPAAPGTPTNQSVGAAPSAKPSIGTAAPAQRLAQRPIGTASRVADANLSAEFNNLSADGETYFGGWPTEAGLRAMAAKGVKLVVALKTPEQVQEARGYDPRKVAADLGINLVVIPVSPGSFSAADVEAFAAAYDASNGPVLIHCGSSSTVGGMWAGYLALKRGYTPEKALDAGRAAGLRDGPMSDAAERVVQSKPASTPKP